VQDKEKVKKPSKSNFFPALVSLLEFNASHTVLSCFKKTVQDNRFFVWVSQDGF
jgi:hypothetical protein